VGGPSELIEDGREGYLLPPREPQRWAQAIERVARSDDGGAAMGLAGRRAVHERFTMAHHLRAMLDVYEQAISEAVRTPS
jgi:glycosyltransferase involved in cell wall biosynthesis